MGLSRSPLVVVCGIIWHDGKILLTKRPDDGRHKGGFWEFPGGKVDFGEDPKEALKRELQEELSLSVSIESFFEYSSHVYSEEKHVLLLAFTCQALSTDITCHDVSDYAFVLPEELSSYSLPDADIPFVKKLIGEKR